MTHCWHWKYVYRCMPCHATHTWLSFYFLSFRFVEMSVFRSILRTVCLVHTQTRYRRRRCGHSMLGICVFIQHMFIVRGFLNRTEHMVVCARVYMTALSLLFSSLSLFTFGSSVVVFALFSLSLSVWRACNYASGAHNWLISYSIDQTYNKHTFAAHRKLIRFSLVECFVEFVHV